MKGKTVMNHSKYSLLKNQRGMTLVEIMVVVAIIAGIAALVGVSVFGNKEKANAKLTKTQMSTIEQALKTYRLDNNRYPTTDQGLAALVEKPTSGKVPEDYPEEGYLDEVPKDAWGNEYNYASPGSHGGKMEIWSNGPDQEEGTDDDITSWDNSDDAGE